MKVIAYYLPQFHTIPENDEWWGKGFTEWTNVRKGVPLYKNHYQPKIPLEGYYSLENKSTMVRQAELANEYGITGMAFYHYWFEGKMLLQRPAENLLKWQDVPMNFMFFWANHNWVRSWEGTKTLLMEQTYGGEKDWKNHFDYMLPFFKDDRYIKIKGKPAVGIYNASSIPDLDKMLLFWNKLAKRNGLDGIYIIETIMDTESKPSSTVSNAVTLRAPNIATRSFFMMKIFSRIWNYPELQKYLPFFYPYRYSYKKTKENIIKISEQYECDKDIMFGDFVSWDNTCRHKRRGSIAKGESPELFGKYLEILKSVAKKKNVEYLFLNAWNEWAEGMYLEPDTVNQFSYLEAIKNVIAQQ